MSQWHREHPELAGTDADPWMQHESYRRVAPMPESERERLRDERERMEYDERIGVEERFTDEGGTL